MTYTIDVAEEAIARIRAQARYIAVEEQAPLNAERWLLRVLAAADSLEQFPRRCPMAAEAEACNFEVRALNIDGFLLLFTINDELKKVRVVTARHGRQLPRPDGLPNEPPPT